MHVDCIVKPEFRKTACESVHGKRKRYKPKEVKGGREKGNAKN